MVSLQPYLDFLRPVCQGMSAYKDSARANANGVGHSIKPSDDRSGGPLLCADRIALLGPFPNGQMLGALRDWTHLLGLAGLGKTGACWAGQDSNSQSDLEIAFNDGMASACVMAMAWLLQQPFMKVSLYQVLGFKSMASSHACHQ